MSFWGPIIAAGVNLASGLLEDEEKEEDRAQTKEIELLRLQDNERDRVAAMQRAELSAETTLAAAEKSLEAAKKRILGDVLLQQGQGQEKLGIEAFRAAANKPERFNDAASVLAQVLSR